MVVNALSIPDFSGNYVKNDETAYLLYDHTIYLFSNHTKPATFETCDITRFKKINAGCRYV